MTINIVGSGIAGSIAARLLRRIGHKVRVFDDDDPFSASRASSNLFTASWLKKFSSPDARRGIEVLEWLFEDDLEKPFDSGIADAAKVRHIPQRKLLVEPDIQDEVVMASPGHLVTRRHGSFDGPTVLCVGHRAEELVPNMLVDVIVGHCFFFEGKLKPGQASLTMPLPYRHHKLYQFDPDTIYFADSVAVSYKTYVRRGDELKARTLANARSLIGNLPVKEFRAGYRPIVDGTPFGELRKLGEGLWSINGGGKNGMVAYANLADKLTKEVR